MGNGKVSINSDVINNSLSFLTKSSYLLENEILKKSLSKFEKLNNIDLFTPIIEEIHNQTDNLIKIHKDLISQISSHLDSTSQLEDELYNDFKSNYSGGTNNSGYSNNVSGSDLTVDSINDGLKINAKDLKDYFPLMDDETKEEIIKLMSMSLDEGTSLIDLLFDSTKSKELFTLLKKVLNNIENEETMTIDDYKNVQKEFIKAIFTSDIKNVELMDNSLLIVKEQLLNICKEKNIEISDLILENEYRDLLKEKLLGIYNGTIETPEEVRLEFANYIKKIAAENNTTEEDILKNKIERLL